MNMIMIIPDRQQMRLQIASQECWLHSPNTIMANLMIPQEGWIGDRLKLMVTDNQARHILHEWLQNGPFDMSDIERSFLRLPDGLRDKIESALQTRQAS